MVARTPYPVLETRRLRLLPLTPDDVEAVRRLWTDADVRRYLFDDQILPEGQVRDFILRSTALFADEGTGLWGVYPRDERRLAGTAGYWYFFDPPELQIIVAVDPALWGRGLATECTQALIRYGFDVLGLETVTGATDAPNVASQRVMERAGMVQDGVTERDDGTTTLFYRIPRPAPRAGSPMVDAQRRV